jgi:DNA polymerase-3 subunit beta
MKIECVLEKLHTAVSKAEKIVGKNTNLPVLSCLLFETNNNNLIIRSTNLDLGLEITIPVKTKTPGKVAIPAGILNSFLNTITQDKNITLEVEDQVVKINTENHEAIIKTISSEDFPTIPTFHDGTLFSINSKDLQNGIKSVLYSSSLSNIKPELASVFIHPQENECVFVATDSFRLAEKKIKIKKGSHISSLLIPFKNAADILKIIDVVDDEITIHATKNQISFSFGDFYLVSRVIDGVFPDYQQILPKGSTTKVTVLKQDLLDTLKISNIFSDAFNQIHITVGNNEKFITLETKNMHVGGTKNKIPATLEGEAIDVNFNYKYISDCLQSITSESVTLLFNGVSRPLVIKGGSDSTFTYLVMPMNR